MFDIHCHLLPGIDDGADVFDDTLRMAQTAVEGRTTAIVCTPHFRPGVYYEYRMLPYVVSKLRGLFRRHGIELELYAGQEILLDDDTVGMIISRELLTINGSVYPLVEFPFDGARDRAFGYIERLVSEGFVPVIAHPERYGFVRSDMSCAAELRSMGCVLQLDKGSIAGAFGREIWSCATRLLDRELADVVASDAHGPYVRTPYLADAHEYISSEWSVDYADLLLIHNPSMIINNRAIKRYRSKA